MNWKTPAPGHHSGSMVLWMSFDEEEKLQLAGSPLAIPYDVAVVSLLDVDPTPLTITTTFADPIQTRTVQLGLNAGTKSWDATLDLATEPGQPFVPQVCAFTAAGGLANPGPPYGSVPMVTCTADGKITLAFLPEPPGTYDGTLYVQAIVEHEGQEYRVEKEIPLTYTVVASGQVTAFFYPAETHLTVTQGYGILGARYRLLLDEGSTCDRSRKQIEYLSHPPEADGNIHADGWWTEDPYQAAVLFDLPAGAYQARVRYPISVNGVESWLDHPVTLDIVPP